MTYDRGFGGWMCQWNSIITAHLTVLASLSRALALFSGILRLLDLATAVANATGLHMFLLAPDPRESDVRDQLLRPAFRSKALPLKFLAYKALEENRASMAHFGTGILSQSKKIEVVCSTSNAAAT